MRRKKRQPNELGFGLIEVLVAIALFVTAITALLAVLTSSAHAVRQSQDATAAQDLAERLIEDMRAQNFALMASGAGATTVNYTNNGNLTVMNFTYGITVTSLPAVNPTMKDIAVQVQWTGDNLNRSVVLETAVFK